MTSNFGTKQQPNQHHLRSCCITFCHSQVRPPVTLGESGMAQSLFARKIGEIVAMAVDERLQGGISNPQPVAKPTKPAENLDIMDDECLTMAKKRGITISRAVRTNGRSQQSSSDPSNSQNYWCSQHGHNLTHSSSGCYHLLSKLHPPPQVCSTRTKSLTINTTEPAKAVGDLDVTYAELMAQAKRRGFMLTPIAKTVGYSQSATSHPSTNSGYYCKNHGHNRSHSTSGCFVLNPHHQPTVKSRHPPMQAHAASTARTPVTTNNGYYCEHHGHNLSHLTSECRVLNPRLKPKATYRLPPTQVDQASTEGPPANALSATLSNLFANGWPGPVSDRAPPPLEALVCPRASDYRVQGPAIGVADAMPVPPGFCPYCLEVGQQEDMCWRLHPHLGPSPYKPYLGQSNKY